jgi:hypothetical protein
VHARRGAVISALLNIAGVALVLPNAALALFFLGVGVAARQTLGSLVKGFARMLLELPSFEYLLLLVLAAIAIIVAMAVAMVRVPILLPITILAIGIASSLYVFWALGLREGAGNPLAWLAAVGLVLAGIQLWRNLQNDA